MTRQGFHASHKISTDDKWNCLLMMFIGQFEVQFEIVYFINLG